MSPNALKVKGFPYLRLHRMDDIARETQRLLNDYSVFADRQNRTSRLIVVTLLNNFTMSCNCCSDFYQEEIPKITPVAKEVPSKQTNILRSRRVNLPDFEIFTKLPRGHTFEFVLKPVLR